MCLCVLSTSLPLRKTSAAHHTAHTTRAPMTPTPPPRHQRARCLKFSPSLPTIQINNRRNAEEAYYVREECPLIEHPNHCGAVATVGGCMGEKGMRLFHALLTRSQKLLNVKCHFSICYRRWMRPPDKGYVESEVGVRWWGDVGSEGVFVSPGDPWIQAGSRLHLKWIRLL